ncbi:M23 family metallopeptidase [Lewinella sp. IMCC34183]|uniref:M23 family metallopeptidase n=1 Tax=Lewinella sp. IMCC34183 TaxID=2248762 RepID=UPI000E23234D|nr:M23 family metallopeptidase [Lewinella sp. IMCC34183]
MTNERRKIVIGESGRVASGSALSRLLPVVIPSLLCGGVLGFLVFRLLTTPTAAPLAGAEGPPVAEVPAYRFETIDGVVRQTSTLGAMLEVLGVNLERRRRLLERPELSADMPIAAGTIYRLEYGAGPERPVRALTFEGDARTLYHLRFLPYAQLEVTQREISEHDVHYAGIVTDNFWLSILESDSLHHSLIPMVEEAMKWTVDLFHLAPGDRYKLLYTEERRDGRTLGIDHIDAIQVETDGRTHTVFGQPVGDTTVYLNYYGAGLRQRFLKAPVKFGIVSSRFSLRRRHPVTGEVKRHGGTDFAAPRGSPIYALADGTVLRRAEDPRNGRYVELRHDDTYSTMYLHMEDFVPDVSVGEQVRQGQVIGYVGSSGLATGPHVCLRFRNRGTEEDFLRYQGETVVSAPSLSVEGFPRRRDSLLRVLANLPYEEVLF